MFGWFSAAAARASYSKRSKRSGSEVRNSGRILIATSRSNRVSRARYTSPIPPAPRGERISYCPRIAPGARVIRNTGDYTFTRWGHHTKNILAEPVVQISERFSRSLPPAATRLASSTHLVAEAQSGRFLPNSSSGRALLQFPAGAFEFLGK